MGKDVRGHKAIELYQGLFPRLPNKPTMNVVSFIDGESESMRSYAGQNADISGKVDRFENGFAPALKIEIDRKRAQQL